MFKDLVRTIFKLIKTRLFPIFHNHLTKVLVGTGILMLSGDSLIYFILKCEVEKRYSKTLPSLEPIWGFLIIVAGLVYNYFMSKQALKHRNTSLSISKSQAIELIQKSCDIVSQLNLPPLNRTTNTVGQILQEVNASKNRGDIDKEDITDIEQALRKINDILRHEQTISAKKISTFINLAQDHIQHLKKES